MTCHNRVLWILRFTVVASCVGHAWWLGRIQESPLMSWLHSPRDVGGWEFTEDFALRTQTGFAITLGLTAIVTCFRTYSVLLILVSLIQLLIATAMWQMADGFQIVSPWISASIAKLLPYLAQGGRVAAPLVLLLYDRRDREPLAAWESVARWGTSLAFAGHGLEALWHSPGFTDLILFSALRAGISVSEATTKWMLSGIGLIDFLLAFLLVTRRWRFVAIYAAIWGLVTACSRITAFGWGFGWYEVLIRAAHFGLPAALAVYWWQRPTPPSVPASEPPSPR